MKKSVINIFFIIPIFLIGVSCFAQKKVQKDTVLPLKYPFKYNQQGGLFLKTPTKSNIIFDKSINKFMLIEKIGNYQIKTPLFLTPKEYEKYRLQNDINNYFKEKSSALNDKKKGTGKARKNLLPKYYVNSKFFENIFGGNTLEIIPSGQINLKLGGVYQNTENPQIPLQNRSNFTFDFDQQINASIIAKIGKRLKLTANYDTQSTFDFQNVMKIEYTPTEDDIIQNIDAGNITMPIKNSLIKGAQSLFGVKTQLQFGKTRVTAVFSQQNSESKTIISKNGSTIEPFELQATDYDNNRHFFLSQFFRENYNAFLKSAPLINSPINITRIEVWVTNQNSNVKNFRNIIAFADIGESNPNDMVNSTVSPITSPTININGQSKKIPTNKANSIFNLLVPNGGIRNISTVQTSVSRFNMKQGTDYSYLQNARKLLPSEYTLHPELGFISLNRRLNDGEILAVAYQYNVIGASGTTKTTFKVGEFSDDGITAPKNIAVKLLRSEILTTKRPNTNLPFPTWQLMMKNIYSLGASSLNRNGFRFELMYRDDQTGTPQNTLQNAKEVTIRNKTLLNLLNLDKLDQSQYTIATGDGFFDYIEGITVNSQKGYVIFPETEPFGETGIGSKLTNSLDKKKYVFNELYLNTKSQVKNEYQNKDKFLLKGYFKSENNGGIRIGFNVPRGSVRVSAAGKTLVEGVDYVVDYQQGLLQILDPGLKSSGTPINVSTENNTFFNQQQKTFLAIDVEHRFSEKFLLGATFLNLRERPLTQKVNFGAEPINNTMVGFNVDYSTKIPLFTKLINKLPFVDTDAPSNLSVRADMAYLIPGSPNSINTDGKAISYIDDFEASQTPIDIMYPQQWFLASTPNTPTFANFGGSLVNNLKYNDKRAKLAWYSIDQLFYGTGDKPSNIDNNELSRYETRQIKFSELFKEQQLDITQNSLVRTFDLSFYPSERGPYNFDTTGIVPGTTNLNHPEQRWGGIMRSLTTNNFDQANVQYIQFWIMDPYEHYSVKNNEGLPIGIDPMNPTNQVGELYFNLGNISEDILSDKRKQYENGLPFDGIKTALNTNETIWGKTPKNKSITYAFDVSDEARKNEDVGLDGLKNNEEAAYFSSKGVNVSLLNPNDISSDNFQFFRGKDLDAKNASILTRYKNFNNTEGNSPTLNQFSESFPTSSTSYPDTEDINRDQTMNSVESFYEYKVSLNKSDLVKGKNNIVDTKTTEVTLANGKRLKTKWYQFRIPIKSGKPINGISDFNSIRFMRMFLTKFKMPIVLRFGQLQLVRGDWRRYTKTLDPETNPQKDLKKNELNEFQIGVVNIEQNENRYVLPPGIRRERLQGTSSIQQQNEQSVMIKIIDLPKNKIRAIYKNISVDLRRYKQLKMFLHAESIGASGSTADDDLVAIIRLGTDLNHNFYQIEIPLKVSKTGGVPIASEVWPKANNLNAVLEKLGKLKLERDRLKFPVNQLYPSSTRGSIKQMTIQVKGNPTLATVRTIMLGVKNNANIPKSAEVWFDELRSVGFDDKAGWAAVVNSDANFADIANLSLSGKMQTIGFGNVQDRVQQRSLQDMKQYNIATTINIGKMVPKNWNIQVPMSYAYGEEFTNPKYDPKYQDVKFSDAKDVNPNSKNSQNYTRRKSISFINVKKNRNSKSKKKPKFYDVENFSVSYSFNEEYHKDYTIEHSLNQELLAGASYNFNFKPYVIEPFKNSKKMNRKYWAFIKDFNFSPIPKTLVINTRINRNYNEQKSRNLIGGLSKQPTLTQRQFLFNWDYTLGFDLTKSLQLNFNATNNYIYDSFGANEKLQIFDKFFSVGRPDHYHQKLNATYKLPINKIPFLNFITSDYAYTGDFDWKASSQNPLIISTVGNMIQNANTHNFNGNINFERFYKIIKLDKFVSTKKKEKGIGQKITKGIYSVITSLKTARINYSQSNGTLLQGYKPIVGFLGRDNYGGNLAPTLGFVFGSQEDIRNKAIENGWLITRDKNESYVNKRYENTNINKLNYTFSLRPIRSLTIDFRGNKIKATNIRQQLDVLGTRNASGIIENAQLNSTIKPFETGNFTTSYFMLSTSFESNDALFKKFLNYRSTIARRLASAKQPIKGFKQTGQQVLLPAFLAAYSGNNPNSSGLGVFKNIPIPNWTLRYNGFMKYKWFKKHFSSFTVFHGYKSSYTITNYRNNLDYDQNNLLKTNTSGNYQPKFLISSASLIEVFSPLIRVDVKMKNSFSFRGEIKKDRTLTLNLSNNTLTDIKGLEYIFGIGYRIKNVKFNTRITGKKQTLKGDINLRADISLRDNLTIIRSINVKNNQITGGEKLFSIKLLASYALTKNLTTSFYYNHQTFRYAISTTFPRQSINAGFSLIYNLPN